MLGTLEEYPNKPDEGRRSAARSDIIDTEELLPLLDSLPTHSVDTTRVPHRASHGHSCRRHRSPPRQLEVGAIRLRQVGACGCRSRAIAITPSTHYDGIARAHRVARGAVPLHVRGQVSEHQGAVRQLPPARPPLPLEPREAGVGLDRSPLSRVASRTPSSTPQSDAAARVSSVAPSFAAKLKQRRDGLPRSPTSSTTSWRRAWRCTPRTPQTGRR